MHLWCGCIFMRCQNGFLFIIRLENNYSNGCGIVYSAHYSYIFHMFFGFLAKDEKAIYKCCTCEKNEKKCLIRHPSEWTWCIILSLQSYDSSSMAFVWCLGFEHMPSKVIKKKFFCVSIQYFYFKSFMNDLIVIMMVEKVAR